MYTNQIFVSRNKKIRVKKYYFFLYEKIKLIKPKSAKMKYKN